MTDVDPAFLAAYKRLIDNGLAGPPDTARALEHERSSAWNTRLTPAIIAERRAAVQARGRGQ